MSARRVIFMVAVPLWPRDYERFGISRLRKLGFSADVWDLSRLLNGQDSRLPAHDPGNGVLVEKSFTSLRELSESAKTLSEQDVAMICFPLYWGALSIYRLIARLPCLIGTMSLGGIPTAGRYSRMKRELFKRVLMRPGKVLDFLINRAPADWLGVRTMDFALVAGRRGYLSKLCDANTCVIHGCSFDFDLVQQLDDQQTVIAPTHLVFLDSYYPFHPDYALDGIPPPVSPEDYYPKLCLLFEQLERAFKLPVVVAAHPRSRYDRLPDYFGGRRVILGQTAELVRQAAAVINHDSTAQSFAVIFNKPVIFVTLTALERYRHYAFAASIHAMAASLGKSPINLDSCAPVDWPSEMNIDTQKYKRYFADYIRADEAAHGGVWEIFGDFLRSRQLAPQAEML